MKEKLIHFLKTYGNDFFHKLPKYKTALYVGNFQVLQNKYVQLMEYNPNNLTFRVRGAFGELVETVDLFELDEFCL